MAKNKNNFLKIIEDDINKLIPQVKSFRNEVKNLTSDIKGLESGLSIKSKDIVDLSKMGKLSETLNDYLKSQKDERYVHGLDSLGINEQIKSINIYNEIIDKATQKNEKYFLSVEKIGKKTSKVWRDKSMPKSMENIFFNYFTDAVLDKTPVGKIISAPEDAVNLLIKAERFYKEWNGIQPVQIESYITKGKYGNEQTRREDILRVKNVRKEKLNTLDDANRKFNESIYNMEYRMEDLMEEERDMLRDLEKWFEDNRELDYSNILYTFVPTNPNIVLKDPVTVSQFYRGAKVEIKKAYQKEKKQLEKRLNNFVLNRSGVEYIPTFPKMLELPKETYEQRTMSTSVEDSRLVIPKEFQAGLDRYESMQTIYDPLGTYTRTYNLKNVPKRNNNYNYKPYLEGGMLGEVVIEADGKHQVYDAPVKSVLDTDLNSRVTLPKGVGAIGTEAEVVEKSEERKREALQATQEFVTVYSEAIGKKVEMQEVIIENNTQKVEESSESNIESLDKLIEKNEEVTDAITTSLQAQNSAIEENAQVVEGSVNSNMEAMSQFTQENQGIIDIILSQLQVDDKSFQDISDFLQKYVGINISSLNKLVQSNKKAHEKMEKDTKEGVESQVDQLYLLAEKMDGVAGSIVKGVAFISETMASLLQKQLEQAEELVEEISVKYDEVAEKKKESDDKIDSLEEKARNARGGSLLIYQQQIDQEMAKNKQLANQEKDLTKQKEKAEKEAEKKKKQIKKIELAQNMTLAIANVATGITSALSFGPILGPIFAAIIAAKGAIEIAIIAKQMSKLEDGGLLNGKKHSEGGMRIEGTNIEVEGGEYVVNRKSTRENLGLIDYINSQRRKLSPSDLNAYFQSGDGTGIFIPSKAMFADGGQLPVSVMGSGVDISNEALLDAIRSIQIKPVVSVEDINHAQENAVEVNSWIGM